MKTFKETIYFNREKEDNWEIVDQAMELGFKNARNLPHLGYELKMEVLVSEDGKNKVLTINGVDVSDKEIYV